MKPKTLCERIKNSDLGVKKCLTLIGNNIMTQSRL